MRSPSSAGLSPETGMVGADDLDVVTRVGESVSGTADRCAHSAGHQGTQCGAAADQHGIMIMDSMSDLFSELGWRGLVYDSTEGASETARERVS